MSDIDESANVESQVADTQEETTSEVEQTQQEAQETETEQSESEEQAEEAEQSEEQASDDTAEQGETEPPKKSKEDYIRERQERKALRKAQMDFAEQIDPNDWEQRVQAIENAQFVERVENNVNNARRDVADAQNLPVFQQDPDLFTDLMRDVIADYGVFHDTLKEENGEPVFLGFYNPRTGEPISILDVAQNEAAKYERFGERIKTEAQVKASQGEAKMRARADNPVSGKNEAPAFEALSPQEMRENLLKRGYDIK